MAESLYVRFVTPSGRAVLPRVVYTVDQRGLPFWSEWRAIGDGVMAVRCPKTQPFSLAVPDQYATLGQPIRITKLQTPSSIEPEDPARSLKFHPARAFSGLTSLT